MMSVNNCCLVVIVLNFLVSLTSANSIYPPYSDQEKKAIVQFRKLMNSDLYQKFMNTDDYLIRWIRDSDFNLNHAKEKLLQTIKWRKENRIDHILSEDFTYFQRACNLTTGGKDKLGKPISIFNVGKCDLRKIVIAGKADQLERYIYYTIELQANVVRMDPKIRDGTLIINGNGFNLRQHGCLRCTPAIMSLFGAYEMYYPDYVDKLYLINMPRAAHTLIKAVLGILSPKTKKITKVYGFDRLEWETELLKSISKFQLQELFGKS